MYQDWLTLTIKFNDYPLYKMNDKLEHRQCPKHRNNPMAFPAIRFVMVSRSKGTATTASS